jgi:hypothetical protein
VWEPDTLFLLDPRGEADVLAEGGRMADAYQDYFASPDRAALVPGPFGRLGVTGDTALVYPVDGLLPVDEFTVTFRLRAASPAPGVHVLAAFARSLVIEADGPVLRARWLPSDTSVEAPLPVGDDWAVVWVVFDGQELALLDVREKCGPASCVAAAAPVSGADGGLRIAPGPHAVSDLHVSRLARTPGGVRVHHGPALAVDLGRQGREFPPYTAGVLGLYTGFRYGADGVEPDIGTAIRDAQFRACAEAGMPLLRMGGVVSATTVDEHGALDFSVIDEKLDLLHHMGVAFHITLDYNHPLTGGTEDMASLSRPPDDPERYAELCSEVMAHLRSRYRVVSVSLWNEPDIEDYWVGTLAEFHTLWRAVQRRFVQDHPDLLLNTADWAFAKNAIAHLEDIAEAGLPVAAACMHTYAQDLALVRHEVQEIRAAADRLGFDGLPIRITEWGMDILLNQERYADPHSVASAWPNRFKNTLSAAYAVAFVHDVLDADASVDLTTFSSIGSVDHDYLPVSAYTICDEALLSSEDPPRPYPSFAGLSLLWMLGGARVAAVSNWPGLRVLATAHDGTATVVFANYRPWRAGGRVPVALVWDGLPERFTWRQFGFDDSMAADGRLMLLSEGDEADLPLGIDVAAVSVGGFQITAR